MGISVENFSAPSDFFPAEMSLRSPSDSLTVHGLTDWWWLEHGCYMTFQKNWECHRAPTDELSMIFQSGRLKPPTRCWYHITIYIYIYIYIYIRIYMMVNEINSWYNIYHHMVIWMITISKPPTSDFPIVTRVPEIRGSWLPWLSVM